MTTVTKRDLVQEVSKKHQLSQQLVADVFGSLLTEISSALGAGSEVTLRKFGTFSLAVAKAKKGRNPNRPDVEISIPERAVLKFRAAEELKEMIEKLDVQALK
jgi:nucleoid DNA-binding protein